MLIIIEEYFCSAGIPAFGIDLTVNNKERFEKTIGIINQSSDSHVVSLKDPKKVKAEFDH